jgi:hypothetical protein
MLPTNNSYSSTSNPHLPSHRAPLRVTTIDKWREERPPSPKRDGGASAAWSSSRPVPGHRRRQPRPSSPPEPGTPSWAQPPPLPPFSSSRPHRASSTPPCNFGPRYSSSSPLLGILRASLPPPLSPPDGDNDANDQRSVDATMDPSPEDDRLRATQSTSLSSPPPTTGGGEGCRTQRPVAPGITQPLCQVPPHGHPSSSSSSAGDRRGGSGGGGGCRARRQAAAEEAAAAVIVIGCCVVLCCVVLCVAEQVRILCVC